MDAALAAWDAAVARFRARTSGTRTTAEAHVAAATVLVDRRRLDEALRELQIAGTLDRDRVDVVALQALVQATAGRAEAAVQALRRAVAIDTRNPALLYALARHAMRLSLTADAERARAAFHRAVTAAMRPGTRAPESPFERVDLVRQSAATLPIFPLARYAAGYAAIEAGDYAGGIAGLRAAVGADPLVRNDPARSGAVRDAAADLRAGRIDAAHRRLLASVAEAPEHAETRRQLALTCRVLDQQGCAIEQLRAAVRLVPDDERARTALAGVLLEAGRLSEAGQEIAHAIAAGVDSAELRYRWALVYQRQSLLNEASRELAAAETGLFAGRDVFYRMLGSLLVNRADFDGAAAAYARRVDVNPNSAEAHRQLGEVYRLTGLHEAALLEFWTAMWLDPNDAHAHAAAGQVYERLDRHAEAVAAFNRALALDSGLLEARYARGTALLRLGRTADARRDLELVARLQSEVETAGRREFRLDALRREAMRHLTGGAPERAVVVLDEAAAIDASDSRVQRDLGVALVRAGRPLEAIAHFEAALTPAADLETIRYLVDAATRAGANRERERYASLYQEALRQSQLTRLIALTGGP